MAISVKENIFLLLWGRRKKECYDESFAPVVKITAKCMVLALATSNYRPILQMDIQNAFLHSNFMEMIYMKLSPSIASAQPDSIHWLHCFVWTKTVTLCIVWQVSEFQTPFYKLVFLKVNMVVILCSFRIRLPLIHFWSVLMKFSLPKVTQWVLVTCNIFLYHHSYPKT